MPTETDVKVAAALADFRVDVAERFGKLEAAMAERFGNVHAEIASIRTEPGLIRKLGDRLLGVAVGIIGTMIIGAATVAWAASAVNSKVEQQGVRLEKLEGRMDRVERRLDGIDQKLDTLISRTAPKAGG